MTSNDAERTPLLENGDSPRDDSEHDLEHDGADQSDENKKVIQFEDDDKDNPMNWDLKVKYLQVLLVFIIGLICPMASSILSPAIGDIADTYDVNEQLIIGAQTGFVCMLGIGPLFLAPMSETFGRRTVFLTNLILFTLFHIPIALAPNAATFIVFRTFAGLFASVGVANGGGLISDMFKTSERATVLGFYLLGPLLGPTLGPLIGGLILSRLDWRWIFWVVGLLGAIISTACYFLLRETFATIILQQRKDTLKSKDPKAEYHVDGASDKSVFGKIAANSTRATRILTTQPVVLTMSAYQALVFSTMYTLYTSFSEIWSNPPYDFDTVQISLTYLGPAVGFICAAAIIVPYIDKIYNHLQEKNNEEEGIPENRLPLANVGAILLPISLFWFGWTVEKGSPWPVPLASTLLFGASQVSIFNTVQNYYIDSFEKNAASALAAGAFLRSIIGGIVPLFVGKMFQQIGYGWGMSVFGFLSVILMPAPLLFFWYGGRLRERFAIEL